MPIATDNQVQHYSDTRFRVWSEHVRRAYEGAVDIRATVDDVYNACNQVTPTWVDTRTDGPPHLLTCADLLALNGLAEDLKTYIAAHSAYSVFRKACVTFETS